MANILFFRPYHIPHAVMVMVMAFAFHTKDPDGVGDALKNFVLPKLSPLVGSESALLTRKLGAILGGGTLNSFVYTSLLMGRRRFPP